MNFPQYTRSVYHWNKSINSTDREQHSTRELVNLVSSRNSVANVSFLLHWEIKCPKKSLQSQCLFTSYRQAADHSTKPACAAYKKLSILLHSTLQAWHKVRPAATAAAHTKLLKSSCVSDFSSIALILPLCRTEDDQRNNISLKRDAISPWERKKSLSRTCAVWRRRLGCTPECC